MTRERSTVVILLQKFGMSERLFKVFIYLQKYGTTGYGTRSRLSEVFTFLQELRMTGHFSFIYLQKNNTRRTPYSYFCRGAVQGENLYRSGYFCRRRRLFVILSHRCASDRLIVVMQKHRASVQANQIIDMRNNVVSVNLIKCFS